MKYTLVVKAVAEADIQDAEDTYHAIGEELGLRFRQAVEDGISLIRRTPLMHAMDFADSRRQRVKGFPYFIAYRVKDHRVIVLGVFHERRDPQIWQRRVSESTNGSPE